MLRYLIAALTIGWCLNALGAEVACTACHTNTTPGDVHAVLDEDAWSNRGGPSCVACHGAGTGHPGAPDAIFEFVTPSPGERSAVCGACHTDKHGSGNGTHARAGLACNDCHTVHAEQPETGSEIPVPAAFERAGAATLSCLQCHQDVSAEFEYNERHRLQENALTCTSCHDPHGPSTVARLGAFKDETCAKCHAAQAGPFVFEHQASRIDGCTACHAPHGSPNRHMLTHQAVGEMCYSCHTTVPQFHLGFNPAAPPRFDINTVCTNCHVTIHGSNLDRNLLR